MNAHRWCRIPVTVAVAIACLALPRGAVAGSLFPNPAYTVGSNPYGFAMADFNRDGFQDLVASNQGVTGWDGGPGDLSILFGRGDGTFAPEVRVPTSHHPVDVLAADVDRNGVGDLIVAFVTGTSVLMKGLGDGTFGPESPITDGSWKLHLADFNGDGIVDLLKDGGGSGTPSFQALFGRGDGGFAAARPVSPGPSRNPIPADVNDDGWDDVLLITDTYPLPTNEIVIYLGDGGGHFTPAGSIATGDLAMSVVTADLDGDGHVDLGIETARLVDGRFVVPGPFLLYYGAGDATFAPASSSSTVDFGGTSALLASDLNGDGFQDFLRVGYSIVTPFLGAGDRTYTRLPSFETGSNLIGSIAADFNRDRRLDLAILSPFSEAVFIYAGNGDGTFGPAIDQTLLYKFEGGLVTEDFTGDGILDIAAAVEGDDQVAVQPGHGDGTFGRAIRTPAGVAPILLASADMNGDGRRDLVVGMRNWHFPPPEVLPPGSLLVLPGNGDGSFRPVAGSAAGAAAAAYDTGPDPRALHVRDLDGDGVADVLVANGTDAAGTVTPDLSFFHGHGDGTLGPEVRLPVGAERVDPYGWTRPLGLASGDLDRDGRRDIVVAMSGVPQSGVPGTVRVLRGLPGGAFGDPLTVGATVSSSAVSVADLDGDRDEDIAVAAWYFSITPGGEQVFEPGGLHVLLNDGHGAFGNSGLLPAGIGPTDVQVADLNADGVPDLVATNIAGYAAVLPGRGGGAFGAAMNFGLFGQSLAFVRGDFDRDGLTDLFVMSYSGGFVLHNQVFPRLRIDARISFSSRLGRGSGTLTWTTNAEGNLRGFNIIERTPRGSIRLNEAVIGCEECTTGLGHTYAYVVPKHRSGRNLYIEAVHLDGRVETFGPAVRN